MNFCAFATSAGTTKQGVHPRSRVGDLADNLSTHVEQETAPIGIARLCTWRGNILRKLTSLLATLVLPRIIAEAYTRSATSLTMPLLHLNEDVLSVILQCLTPGQALQLGMTCRYANDLTIPRRVSRVTLRTLYTVNRFCDFCLVSRTKRPPHIMELVIMGEPLNGNNQLAEVIRHATLLRTLNIWTLEHALSVCPGLDEALRTRTTLTYLSLGDNYEVGWSGPRVHDLVSQIASPIVDLNLGWWYLDTGVDWWTMIAALAPTLHTFRLMTLHPDMRPLPPPPASAVCPHVDTIHLSQSFAFRLDYFARVFPNVRTLVWRGWPLGDYWRLPVPPLPGSWAVLDRLVIPHKGIPTLQPGTRVRRVDVLGLRPDILAFVASVTPAVLTASNNETCFQYIPLISESMSTLRYLSYIESSAQRVLTLDSVFAMTTDLARNFVTTPLVAISLDLCKEWQEGHYPAPESNCNAALAKAAATVASIIQTVTFVCIKAGRSDVETGDEPCLVGWFEVCSRDGVQVQMRRLPWWEEDVLEERLLALTWNT